MAFDEIADYEGGFEYLIQNKFMRVLTKGGNKS